MSAAQLQAVRVLTGIIRRATEAGLPGLKWSVYPYDGAELEAQPWRRDDGDDLAAMRAWADHLGAEIVTTVYERYTAHEVRAEVDGVQIKIYEHTDVNYAFIQVDAKKAGVKP